MLPEGYLPILPTIERELSQNKNIYTPRIMITQKAISAKINEDLLAEVDEYLSHRFMRRNTLINRALKMYMDAVKLAAWEAQEPDSEPAKRLRRMFEMDYLQGGRRAVLRFPSSQEP